MDKKFYRIGLLLSSLLLFGLSCMIPFLEGPTPNDIENEQILHLTQAAARVTQTFLATTPDYIYTEATLEPPKEDVGDEEEVLPDGPAGNPGEKIVFDYSGENPSYHTGLRNRTVFYLDYDTGKVWADERASFEEPFGIQSARGNDSIAFDGAYDAGTKTFSGIYTISTQFTASGGESGATIVTYSLDGTLSASLVEGQWTGTVTGKASLKQEWPGGESADSLSESNVNWTIASASIEQAP